MALNYEVRWGKFCGYSFDEYISRSSSLEQVATISTDVVHAWESCILAQSRGFGIYHYEHPSREAFTLLFKKHGGEPTFTIKQWRAEPNRPNLGLNCQVVGHPESSPPVTVSVNASLLCRKNPDASFQFVVSTNEDEYVLNIGSTEDELRRLRAEIAQLRGQLEVLQNDQENAYTGVYMKSNTTQSNVVSASCRLNDKAVGGGCRLEPGSSGSLKNAGIHENIEAWWCDYTGQNIRATAWVRCLEK
jgi:hypothetical protein